MPNGFLEDDKGNRSMNRLLALLGGCLGAVVALGGLAGFFATDAKAEAAGLCAMGLSLFGGSEWLKNRGRSLENGGVK